jgi:hypothetical protein
MKRIALYAATVLALSTHASAEDWPKLVSADDGSTLFVKPRSGSLEMDKNGDSLFVVDAKHQNGTAVHLTQLAIKLNDCIHEKGTLEARDLGSPAVQYLPFIFGSNTAASIAAETLCEAGFLYIKNAKIVQE